MVIVIESPTVDDPAGVRQAEEQLTVEQFVAQAAVEAFDIAVFPRAPLGDEQRLHAGSLEPPRHRLGYELGAVIAAQMFWCTSHGEQILQHFNDALGRE